MVSSIIVIISSRLRLATMWSVSLSILSIQQVFCRGLVDPSALHGLILIGDFVLEGILNVLPGLSLFTLVFISIFPAWQMGAYDFCLSCSGFMGDKFFSLSLMLFGRRIGDLCNSYFIGDFALLQIVCAVDPTCVFILTFPHSHSILFRSLPTPNPSLSWCLITFSRV